MELIQTVGRRKRSIARAMVQKGSGKIVINNKESKQYFPSMVLHARVTQPLVKLDALKKYDIKISVDGGGITGQSEAIRLAIARAMVAIDPETKKSLKEDGLMTRDARKVERKKPGQKKARKRFQFTKR
ncbi:MAG TPA: 30S ribosomal protein S9 [Bacteroidia bacterium]|jgi:small subunit ribosomal protein S9|nr:30S ribosomal protein S9 [Bacteroidia bacterium]